MEATANLGLVRPVISEFVTVFNYYVVYLYPFSNIVTLGFVILSVRSCWKYLSNY